MFILINETVVNLQNVETIDKDGDTSVFITFKGGATRTLECSFNDVIASLSFAGSEDGQEQVS